MDTAAAPPRFLGRRILAFLIDLIIAYSIFFIASLVIEQVSPLDLEVPFPAGSYFCQQPSLNSNIVEVAKWLSPQKDERVHVGDCTVSILGMKSKRVISVRVAKPLGNGTVSRSVSYYADQEAAPQTYIDLSGLVYLLVPALFAIAVAVLGTTPGKAIFKLKVAKADGLPLSNRQAFTREYLKMFPSVAIAALTLATSPIIVSADSLRQAATKLATAPTLVYLAAAIFVGLAVIGLYGVSLLRWRGQMFYDRVAGSRVVLA